MFVISGSVHLSLACLLRNIPEVCDAALLYCRFGGCALWSPGSLNPNPKPNILHQHVKKKHLLRNTRVGPGNYLKLSACLKITL